MSRSGQEWLKKDTPLSKSFFLVTSSANSVKLLPWCISSGIPFHNMHDTLPSTTWQGGNIPATVAAPEQEESPTVGLSSIPAYLTETPPPILPLLLDLPLVGTLPMGHPFFKSTSSPLQKKWDCSPSGSFGNHHGKRTHVHSPEAEVRSEHSSAWSGGNMPKMVPETRPSTEEWGWEPANPPSSPTRATADPDDGTAAASSWSTEDQPSSDSDSSRENLADSNLDTASGDYIMCSDTDEVSIQTAHKQYQRRVRTSCKLSKGNIWTEAQLKRINDSHQDMLGHNHDIIRLEQKHSLVEDCNSFEIQKMMVRTDKLHHITAAMGSKIHTIE